MSQNFHTVDRLRIEVEDDPTGLVNLVQNPSGELGGWGWITPATGSSMASANEGWTGYGQALLYTTASSPTGNAFYTEAMPVVAGQYVAARWLNTYAPYGQARARLDWLKADHTVLSSTAWTGFTSHALTPRAIAPAQAPANAAFVRLTFEVAASGGTYPSTAGGNSFALREVTVATAATSGELGARRRNLITNPSFETGTTGWAAVDWTASYPALPITRVTGGHVGTYCGKVSLKGLARILAPSVAVTPGSALRFSLSVKSISGARITPTAIFANAGGAVISEVKEQPFDGTPAWQAHEWSATAPAGAASVRIGTYANHWELGSTGDAAVDAALVEQAALPGPYFDGSTPAADGWTYSWEGTPHASTSTAISSNLQYAEPIRYRDVTGPAIEASIEREALNLGTMSVVIRDALLDPARDDLLKPGRKVRALALAELGAGETEWRPIFTGRLASSDVTYDLKDPNVPTSKRARITFTANDALTELANQERPEGVRYVAELPHVLEGCGIPWLINGSGNQVPTANIVTRSPGQKAIDQIAVTRDSDYGIAWIDPRGVLVAQDRAYMEYDPIATLDEDDYSGYSMTWGSEDCINEVNVIIRRLNLATGATAEVARGPYRLESEWQKNPRSATFTLQGMDDSNTFAQAYAEAIFALMGTPKRRVSMVSYALEDASAFAVDGSATALRDVCDLLRVVNTEGEFDRTLRVKTIKHRITGEKWLVELGFGEPDSVEAPTVVPPVQSAGTYASKHCGTVSASATSLAPGQNVAVGVVFSPRFKSSPCVTASLTGWPSNTAYIVVRVTGKSAAGCTINFSNIGSSTVTFTGLVADYIALAQE